MLSVTPAHALQTESGEWRAAGQLQKGEYLHSTNGVVRLDSTFTESVSPTPVISYELEGGLDYLVGEMPVVVGGLCHLKTIKDKLDLLGPTEFSAFWQKVKALNLSGPQRTALLADAANGSPQLLNLLRTNEGLNAWKVFDGTFPALRNNPSQLQRFTTLAASNNLGLNATTLEDLLKARTSTGNLPWEHPEKILEAVERASNANVAGTKIGIKKFPTPEDGSENFILNNAKQYQLEASGDAYLDFEVTSTLDKASFDNIDNAGRLIDRKYGHSGIFTKDATTGSITIKNQNRVLSALEQAKKQVDAANGKPIRWEISTELGADGLRLQFSLSSNVGIRNIEVVYVPQQTIIN